MVKNLLANAGDSGDTSSILGSGRSPRGRNGNPLEYSFFFFNFILFLKPFLYSFMYFWPHCAACQILVPQPGIKQVPPSLEAPSLNLWTAGMSQDAVLVQGILKIIPEDLGQVWD